MWEQKSFQGTCGSIQPRSVSSGRLKLLRNFISCPSRPPGLSHPSYPSTHSQGKEGPPEIAVSTLFINFPFVHSFFSTPLLPALGWLLGLSDAVLKERFPAPAQQTQEVLAFSPSPFSFLLSSPTPNKA